MDKFTKYCLNRNIIILEALISFFVLATFLLFVMNSCSTIQEEVNPILIEVSKNWEFKDSESDSWLVAEAPGVVHMDLLRNGIIDEPFFRENEKDQQWIDKKDWEYRTVFNVSNELLNKDRLEMIFKGLDTYADVYLNDSLILVADNMHRTWMVDCKSLLKVENNTLKIYFHSPIKIGISLFDQNKQLLPAINDHSEIGGVSDKKVSVYTRKAQYHYGWDWGPRFVTSGIWRPIVIEAWDIARIDDVFYSNREISPESATINVKVEVSSGRPFKGLLMIKDNESGAVLSKTEVDLSTGHNLVETNFEIKNPKLWWSNGLGDPHLYNFSAYLESKKVVIAEQSTNFGIRSVKLIRENDSIGTSFYFELNGLPVYAKGANYIPNDIFLTRVSKEKYENTIAAAAKSNLNMLRVWGGGIYENDIFYDLCDKYGILVWQDFMFACNMYPSDTSFLNNVKQEFIDNVKRLRNHPSVALWCGNNELLQAWHFWGWHHPESIYQWTKQDSTDLWNNYLNIFHHIIPSVLSEFDTTRSYWPSSPAADFNEPQTLKSGNYHYWKNRNQLLPITIYEEIIPRFMGEYGVGSTPEYYSVKNFTAQEDRTRGFVRSYARPTVLKDELIDEPVVHYEKSNYTTRNFRTPKNFESELYISQLVQGYLVEIAIHAHRRNKPYNMGTLVWMLNECWPVRNGSAIDYYGRWKAEMYVMKRSYAEVLLSSPVKSNHLQMYVVSDRPNSFKAHLVLELIDFEGNIIWSDGLDLDVPVNSSFLAYEKEFKDFLQSNYSNKCVLRSRIYEGDQILSEHYKFFVHFKELELSKPSFTKTVKKTPTGYEMTLETNTFVKSVFLTVENPIGVFSDNFFDLLPGEIKTISFTTKEMVEDFSKIIDIYSLVDSYEHDVENASIGAK